MQQSLVTAMLNSRDISLLRADVAANCRLWVDRCKAEGLNVLVTQTVRDAEYQAYLYAQGRIRPGNIVTNGKQPTFHWNKAGLAFDFCKNVKGHEYDDAAFFKKAAAIAKEMGFTWGGDWKSFVDKPHIQWDAHGKYTNSMILAGKMPPTMPLYKANTTTTNKPAASSAVKVDTAKAHSASYNRKYTVTASALNLRSGAGEKKPIIKTMPNGTVVTCYGFYSVVGSTIWLLVQMKDGTTGFCSKKYLK